MADTRYPNTNRYAKISFLVNGYVTQDVLITNPNISANRLQIMLDDGSAANTIQEGGHVCVTTADWEPIGEITYVEDELKYSEFTLEDAYTIPTSKPKQFPISRMALSFAIGEYVSNETLSTTEIMKILEQAGDAQPPLAVLQQHSGLSGNQLLEEIKLTESGIKNIMEYSYSAGARGEEMV